MARKTGKWVAGQILDAPRWRGRSSARRAVAQRLCGAPCDVRPLRALRGGTDNRGVSLFETIDLEGRRTGHRFVEKITRDRTEFCVAGVLSGAGGSPVMPRVHGASAHPKGYAVFMEWWPEAADPVAAAEAPLPDPAQLARAVHRLAEDLAPLRRPFAFPQSPPYFSVLHTRFRAYLRDAAGIAPARLAQTLLTAQSLPRTVGHDDLNVENIVPRAVTSGIGVGLIDVGSIRVNAAGSSFQRLALHEIVEGDEAPLRMAIAEYARISGFDPERLRFAAYLYAASRRLNRNVNKLDPHPFNVPAQLVDRALRQL